MVALRYNTTTSAVSRPNARVARSLACWLWLPGGVKPPPDCSRANTPVPHTAAAATTTAATSRTSRRRRYTKCPHASNIGPSAATLLPVVYLCKRCKLQTVLTWHTRFTLVTLVYRWRVSRGPGSEPARPGPGRDHRRDQGDRPADPGGGGAGGGLAAGDRGPDGDDRPRPVPILRQP